MVVNEYSLTFPSIVRVISNWLTWLNLSLFSLVNLSCRVSFIDQFDRLLIVTLLPIGLMVLLGVLHAVLRFNVLFDERTRKRWQHALFTTVLVIMFLILPSVRLGRSVKTHGLTRSELHVVLVFIPFISFIVRAAGSCFATFSPHVLTVGCLTP